jgi:hypothetical protein
MVSSPAASRTEDLPWQTRCLVTRCRVLALEAQAAAGEPPRPGQVQRALELLSDGRGLPATSTPGPSTAADRQGPDPDAKESLSARCCSSQNNDGVKAEESQKEDREEPVLCFRDILPREKRRR